MASVNSTGPWSFARACRLTYWLRAQAFHDTEVAQFSCRDRTRSGCNLTTSKIEKSVDMLMRTFRNFVQAMGGDVEVRAVFPDRAIEINSFSSLAGKPAKDHSSSKKK